MATNEEQIGVARVMDLDNTPVVVDDYSNNTWVDGEIPEAVIPPIDIHPEECTPQMTN